MGLEKRGVERVKKAFKEIRWMFKTTLETGPKDHAGERGTR